jgi:MinD-like ATPase involved in chromosome partitioning or flagellar assembly
MSSIVTFYSYKGGVGRSMALANVAVLLARRGLKVLAVDWDLEAPGLEPYFSYFDIRPGGPGLLRMFMEARDNGASDYTKYTSLVDCDAPHPITLLASGREQDEAYSRNLEAFDWEGYFIAGGGTFVEALRERWRSEFDIVLIDSRTGLSDTGGICTIQLPDIVVAMFTANYQSLYGVRDVMRLAQRARQRLAYDRMPLSVFPVPTRWGVHEFEETQSWLNRVAEGLKEFYEDWLPKTINVRDVVERVKVPQTDFFGFGEKLAVVEQGVSDPQGMGFTFDKIAAFLASDFTDLAALVGQDAMRESKSPEALPAGGTSKARQLSDYSYDIFISHDESTLDWVIEFREALKQELAGLGGQDISIFVDVREIRTGASWAEHVSNTLGKSKLLVAIVTPRYATSQFAQKEFQTFKDRAHQTGKRLLLPIILRGDNPPFVAEFQSLDLRKFRTLKSSPSRWPAALRQEIRQLAATLKEMIDDAPPYDPAWSAGPLEGKASSEVVLAVPKFGELEPDVTKFRVDHQPDSATYKLLGQTSSLLRPLPFPQSRGGLEPVLLLSDTLGPNGAEVLKTVEQDGRIAFHAVGSTGNTHGPREMALVADRMSHEFYQDFVTPKPSFLFHLGDIIYNFGEAKYYYDQFYVPYRHYPRPILAIPGNHDGMVVPKSGGSSLQAFLANFCTPQFLATPEAGGLRTTQIQPGVYFTLEAPFVRILALYSNTLEGPGVISSERDKFSNISDIQLQYLETALARIKKESFQGAVIVAVHHDPYSPRGGRNPGMAQDLDQVSRKTGVWPHAILSSHAHNYQRYVRIVDGRSIMYVVAGNGGNGVSPLRHGTSPAIKVPLRIASDVTLAAFDDRNYGYVRITADTQSLSIDYQPATADSPADSATIDLRRSVPVALHRGDAPSKKKAVKKLRPRRRR